MKKDFRNHPFREGDTVFHPIMGEGVVGEDATMNVRVDFISGRTMFCNETVSLLSFTPYEIPSNWERPYQPKDGDIVFIPEHDSYTDRILIYKNSHRCYAGLNINMEYAFKNVPMYGIDNLRPATPEESQKLLDALENDGFRWDYKKKQLEKIPVRPKEGDLAIAWNIGNHRNAIIGTYHLAACAKANVGDSYFNHCCKFESMEQYESIRRGEYD